MPLCFGFAFDSLHGIVPLNRIVSLLWHPARCYIARSITKSQPPRHPHFREPGIMTSSIYARQYERQTLDDFDRKLGLGVSICIMIIALLSFVARILWSKRRGHRILNLNFALIVLALVRTRKEGNHSTRRCLADSWLDHGAYRYCSLHQLRCRVECGVASLQPRSILRIYSDRIVRRFDCRRLVQ